MIAIRDREFYCPLDDGEDFTSTDGTPSTNCGGKDFGSRLALDIHYSTVHSGMELPVYLSVSGRYGLPSAPRDYGRVLRDRRLFVAGENPDFHGAPPIPNSSGWGLLGTAAGIGQGLPQARYVVWSQGTPIAWYLDDRTDKGWVCPEGDYYRYDRVTSRHQNKIRAALDLLSRGTDPLCGEVNL